MSSASAGSELHRFGGLRLVIVVAARGRIERNLREGLIRTPTPVLAPFSPVGVQVRRWQGSVVRGPLDFAHAPHVELLTASSPDHRGSLEVDVCQKLVEVLGRPPVANLVAVPPQSVREERGGRVLPRAVDEHRVAEVGLPRGDVDRVANLSLNHGVYPKGVRPVVIEDPLKSRRLLVAITDVQEVDEVQELHEARLRRHAFLLTDAPGEVPDQVIFNRHDEPRGRWPRCSCCIGTFQTVHEESCRASTGLPTELASRVS
jgi:hypothetical protein